MKKLLTTGLALSMFASMGMVTALATGPITTVDGSDSADVKGTYQKGASADTVYNVDVAWGSMEFTYTAASEGTWNPEKHEYENATTGGWTNAADANKITLTNHSNAAVNATLTYASEASFSAVSGTFSETSGTANDGKIALATAAGTLLANAPTASTTLNLSGVLSADAKNTKIGTVTVTIAAQSGSSGSDFEDGGHYGRE